MRSRPATVPYILTLQAWICVVITSLTAGCGYSRHGLYLENITTVAVDGFGNKSFYQGVELGLTEAIIKEIELRTPYKVTARSSAETVVTGEITQIQQGPLSRRRAGGMVQDVEYQIFVNFEWKDIRSGEVLRQRLGMMVSAGFMPAIQTGETLTHGQNRAVQRVAERVVSVMKGSL